jgi:hypothetical protein
MAEFAEERRFEPSASAVYRHPQMEGDEVLGEAQRWARMIWCVRLS